MLLFFLEGAGDSPLPFNGMQDLVVAVTWENQRRSFNERWEDATNQYRLPLDRPAWSSKDGQHALVRDAFLLPGSDWSWRGEWHVSTVAPWSGATPEAADEGWLYAPSFLISTRRCSRLPTPITVCRRREWRRVAVRVEGEFATHPMAVDGYGFGGLCNTEGKCTVREASPASTSYAGSPLRSDMSHLAVGQGTPSALDGLGATSMAESVIASDPLANAPRLQCRDDATHAVFAELLPLIVAAEGGEASPLRGDASPREGMSLRRFFPRRFLPKEPGHSIVPSHLLKLIYRHGIPQTLRARCWGLVCGVEELQAEEPDIFDELCHETTSYYRDATHPINMDVARTYAMHPYFDGGAGAGAQMVRTALFAFSAYLARKEGQDTAFAPGPYQQQWSFIAAVISLNVPCESIERLFWLLVGLWKQCTLMRGEYESETAAVDKFWTALCEREELAAHLERNQIDLHIVAYGWFQGLFAAHTPPSIACRLLDICFSERSSDVVLRFAHWAVVCFERNLLSSCADMTSANALLNHELRALQDIDAEKIFAHCWKEHQ